MIELKPCPFRVHGERKASVTVPGEYYYNETFMPCMREKCACYYTVESDNEIRCGRDTIYYVLGKLHEDEKGES